MLTLAAGDASAEIAPAVGGAIVSFRWRGHDVLRPTPSHARDGPDVRALASFPLVPYSNRLENARLAVDHRTHQLARNFGEHPHAIHGVGWQRAWSVEAQDATSALLACNHDATDEASSSSWPFAFRATQWFRVTARPEKAMLTTTLAIRNTGTQAFPFGLGWHPYFPRDADTQLAFDAESMWSTDATCIPTERRTVAAGQGFAQRRPIGATTLDNVFTAWSGVAHVRWPAAGVRATLEADASCSHLVVYIPPDREYFAIEPVTHMTDAFNRAARGERDTGTRFLAPGASRCSTMRIIATPDELPSSPDHPTPPDRERAQ